MSEIPKNSDSFDNQEREQLKSEIQKSENFIAHLEFEVNKLQEEMSMISRVSEEWNKEYLSVKKQISNIRITQKEIREIISYTNQWAQIDTDNSFLTKLIELNKSLEANESIELRELVQMKNNARVDSENLRTKLQNEMEHDSAINNLKEILDWRMVLAGDITPNEEASFTQSLMTSIILHKWASWVNKQIVDSSLQISKSDFYRILTEALASMWSSLHKFKNVVIHITLQWKWEIFWANDDNYLKILDLLLSSSTKEVIVKESEPEEIISTPSSKPETKNPQKPQSMVQPTSLNIPQRRKTTSISKIPKSIDLSWSAVDIMISFVKFSEWFEPRAYKDSAWIPTIGWGTIRMNGRKVKMWDTITRVKAEELLRADIKVRFDKLDRDYPWFKDLNKNQQAAFVSFSYNLWSNIFTKWESLKSVMDDIESVTPRRLAQVFIKYNKARNPKTKKLKEVPGLTNRRNREIELMLRPESLKENQRFTVIYSWDTLWDTLVRVVDNIEENNALLSSTLATRLHNFDTSLSAINPYQTVLIEKNEYTYKVTVAEKAGFIIDLHNNVYPINTPLSKIPYLEVPEKPKPYIIASGWTLGKTVVDLFPDVYSSWNDATKQIVSSWVPHMVQVWDEFFRDWNNLIKNGVNKYVINKNWSIQYL